MLYSVYMVPTMTSFFDTYISEKSIADIIDNDRYWGAKSPRFYSKNGKGKVIPNNKPPFHITIPARDPKAFITEGDLIKKGGLEALKTEVKKCAHGNESQRKQLMD